MKETKKNVPSNPSPTQVIVFFNNHSCASNLSKAEWKKKYELSSSFVELFFFGAFSCLYFE